MKRDEHIINRLLQAAKQSPRETSEDMPFSMAARILAGWRSVVPESDWLGLAICFRRAIICAVLVMVISIGWCQFSNSREVPGALVLSNLAQAVQIVP